MLKQKFYVPGHDKKPEYDIVGEAHHYDELTNLFKDKLKSKDKVDIDEVVEATIETEPDNADDKNAIAVKINGTTVGYIAAEKAADLNPHVALLEEKGYVAATKAKARLWSKEKKIIGGGIKIGFVPQEFEKALLSGEFEAASSQSQEEKTESAAPQEEKTSAKIKKTFSFGKYKKLIADKFKAKK